MMCAKCCKVSGLILAALGVAFLLRDFGVWTFWNINWWSAVLLALGLGKFCASTCADCCSVSSKKR